MTRCGMASADLRFEMQTINRGKIEVRLVPIDVVVDKIESAMSTKGKPLRLLFYRHAEHVHQLRLHNMHIGIQPGHGIRVVHYQAQGFLQKVAGFHNLSKKGSYVLSQPQDYFRKWLHVRPAMPFLLVLLTVPIIVSVATVSMHVVAGIIVGLISALVALLFYFNISKKYVLVSTVHMKSLSLQLMDGFKSCASEQTETITKA